MGRGFPIYHITILPVNGDFQMDRQFKQEMTISKIDLLSRKIASLTVSRIPVEYISPNRKNFDRKARLLTNQLAESISDMVEAHHDEIMDYVSESLIVSNTIETSYKSSVLARNGEMQLTPKRLSAYMRTALRRWRNIPYQTSKVK